MGSGKSLRMGLSVKGTRPFILLSLAPLRHFLCYLGSGDPAFRGALWLNRPVLSSFWGDGSQPSFCSLFLMTAVLSRVSKSCKIPISVSHGQVQSSLAPALAFKREIP